MELEEEEGVVSPEDEGEGYEEDDGSLDSTDNEGGA